MGIALNPCIYLFTFSAFSTSLRYSISHFSVIWNLESRLRFNFSRLSRILYTVLYVSIFQWNFGTRFRYSWHTRSCCEIRRSLGSRHAKRFIGSLCKIDKSTGNQQTLYCSYIMYRSNEISTNERFISYSTVRSVRVSQRNYSAKESYRNNCLGITT